MKATTLKEKASKKMEDWKKDIHQLKQQLEHTADEAKAAFEKEKESVVEWVDEVKTELEKLEHSTDSKTEGLKAKLDELRLQAALGKAETQAALQEQQKQLKSKMRRLNSNLQHLDREGEESMKSFYQKTGEAIGKMQTRFDVFRWQLSERKENLIQFGKDTKKEVGLMLDKMLAKLGETKEEVSEKWEDLSEELSEKWHGVKTTLAASKKTTFFSDLHFDHRQWKSEIDFWEDELSYFEKLLAKVSANRKTNEISVQIEHFQNVFKVHHVEVNELENEIISHEIRLAQLAQNHEDITADSVFKYHNTVREKVDMQRKLFRELKNEFYNFLKENDITEQHETIELEKV